MASPPLVLPGVLFVGEDDRARIVAHTGPAAGWHVPRGILGWSTEVSVVARDALTEEIRRTTKLVMPEEQIPPVRMPLTSQAAQKSPLVALSSKLVSKLVELGVRVHTVGVDRVTSSFYYLAEGGGEDQIRIEGDLVQSVGTMLGERADNAAIERVLDGLPDRLLRALSKDRVSELTVELAAALPRAAADGSGTQDLDLEAFEKALSDLVGSGEKYTTVAQEIASKLAETNERRVEVPLFGEARKVSQGPFDIAVGERRVSLPTYERWVMSAPPASAATAAAGLSSAPRAAAPRPGSSPPAKMESVKPDANDEMLANLDSADSGHAARLAEAARVADAKAADTARAKAASEAKAVAEAQAAAQKAAADAQAAAAKAAAAAQEAEIRRKLEAAAAQADAEMAAEAAAKADAVRKAEADVKAALEAKAAAEAKALADAEAAEAAKVAAEIAEAKAARAAVAAKAAAEVAETKAAEAKAAEAKKVASQEVEDAKAADAARAKAAEKKAFEAKKADKKADRKSGDKKKPEAKVADAKAAKTDAAKDTLKIKRAAAKSSNMTWIVMLLFVVAAAGAAYWKLYLNK